MYFVVMRLRLLHVHVTCEMKIKLFLCHIFYLTALRVYAFAWPDFFGAIKKFPYFCYERNRNSGKYTHFMPQFGRQQCVIAAFTTPCILRAQCANTHA